jgi:hypothetical protein
MSGRYQIAQVNISYAVDSLKSETLADFHELALVMDGMARKTEGFVWRLEWMFDDPKDPYFLNISVWETVEALRRFTFEGDHLAALRRGRKWFRPPRDVHSALWWVPAGTLPDYDDGMARLATLKARGPSPEAFTFRRRFPAPTS